MCGICGLYSPGGVDPALLRRMTDTIRHRGPDDEGFHVDGPIGLGVRRLSIIDVAGGHMPIHGEDRHVWVVQNGEIYNFQELRRDLEGRGHRFETRSDTEVIAHLYEDVGERVFERLRGMFAVAIWDAKRQRLLLGRDRVGKKPLYYAWDGKRLVFGSEIKALRAVPDLGLDLDPEALNYYFSYLYVPDPLSIFKQVRKLPAAHWLALENGHLTVQPYWDLRFDAAPAPADENECVEALRALLVEAVRDRLVSDVPLGAFLSGGIDSATVVGIMSQLSTSPVKTFSIGFDEESFDELRYARIAAQAFGTDHHEEVVRPDAAELLEALVEHFDEPFGDPSALPTFMVSRLARRHVTVALSGDGGDEAFAGYESHAVHLRDEGFHRRLPSPVRRLGGAVLTAGARASGHAKLARVAGAVARANRPAAQRWANVFDKRQRRQLFSADVHRALGVPREEALFEALERAQPFPDFLAQVLYADTKAYLTNDILVKVDRASMANSLEVRAPLVDHRVLELAARIPSSLKLRGGVSKYVFKKAVESFVPREIVYREKHGFGVPIRTWFRTELHDLLQAELLGKDDAGAALFDRAYVETLLRQHTSGARDWSVQLWPLLVFRMWYRRWAP